MPMNFGRHYLELNGLNDLQLMCSGGEVFRTSSFPLAMNSLVICDLVGKQQMKELDVEEFSRSSVASFVDCCYTGTTSVLTSETFREVNKLSAVFKVEWMAEECLKFYTDLCSNLTSGSLKLALFLFEEAAYILKERNDRDLQNALSTKLAEMSCLRLALVEDFISRDPNQQEYVNTDLCLSLASSNEGTVLYEWLIDNFEGKPHPVKLSDVEKRFLTLPSLTLCLQTDKALYERLLESVELSLSAKDLMSLFKIFTTVPLPSSAATDLQNSPSSSSCSRNEIVYPIEIPALGECTSFLDAVKVIDKDPRIKSFAQFVSSLDSCSKVFGDPSSSELVEVITAAMEKRKSLAYLVDSTYFTWFPFLNKYPQIKGILSQYMNGTQDSFCKFRYTSLMNQLSFPSQHSELLFLDLHDYDEPSCCDENPRESDKRCKVAVEVSVVIKDEQSWPVFTIKLVEDRDILEAVTDAHFHQDPDFLQHIVVDCEYSINNFTVCSDLNTATYSLDEIYKFWKRIDYTSFYIIWPRVKT